MDQLQELLDVFQAEAAEQIDELAELIERLRACPESQVGETVGELLRVAHNMKGGARCVGAEDLAVQCHGVEDLLQPLMSSGERPPASLLDQLVEMVTRLQHLLGALDAEACAEQFAKLLEELEPVTLARPTSEVDLAAVAQRQREEPELAAVAPHQPDRQPTIRVETSRLDALMSHTHELLVMHARMLARNERWKALADQLSRRASDRDAAGAAVGESLGTISSLLRWDRQDAQQFGYLVAEMGAAMRQLRMLPLERNAAAWRSTVRDVAQAQGKQVALEVQAGGIEIDRRVLEQLRDPMIHILRNAVDHGIEAPEVRMARGKPMRGRIVLRAEMDGAMVLLEIADDGRGLDAESIKATAVRRGIVESEVAEKMGEDDALGLLFASGFSSAAEVSQVSGRGVGLSVVKRNVEALGGYVQVTRSSRLGGASFLLHVPASVLTTKCLLVLANAAAYALPVHSVTRVMSVPSSRICRLDTSPTLQLEGADPLNLRFLSDLMGFAPGLIRDQVMVVVLGRGDRKLAVVVDDIVGERDIVSKPLPAALGVVEGVSGGAILDDGSLALVLDVGTLFELLQRKAGTRVNRPSSATSAVVPRILVVDDTLTSRVLIRNMLVASGFHVSVAVDGEEAWAKLGKESYDLIVSDVQMPHLNGFELTRRVRQSDSLRKLPVVLVTQLDQPEDIAQGSKVGANEYIVKGQFSQRELLAAIQRLL